MPKLKSINGRVDYKLSKLPGCCGVAVVWDVYFTPYNIDGNNLNKLYKDFYKFLTTSKKPFNLNRCKIIMSDCIPGNPNGYYHKTYGSIYDFCMKTKGWQKGTSNFNRKTGNYIQVFELDRECIGDKDYGDY